MLVLTRKAGETIAIGNDILLQVVEVSPGRVKLGIVAPKHVSVDRLEVRERREGGPRKGEFETTAPAKVETLPLHRFVEHLPPAVGERPAPVPAVNRIRKMRLKPR